MNHIRKFNENNKKMDFNYINMIFIDFIDKGAKSEINDNEYYIYIDEPMISPSYYIDSHLEKIEKLHNFYLEINSCINKVKEEYPDIDINFHIRETGENNAWINSIKRIVSITFTLK